MSCAFRLRSWYCICFAEGVELFARPFAQTRTSTPHAVGISFHPAPSFGAGGGGYCGASCGGPTSSRRDNSRDLNAVNELWISKVFDRPIYRVLPTMIFNHHEDVRPPVHPSSTIHHGHAISPGRADHNTIEKGVVGPSRVPTIMYCPSTCHVCTSATPGSSPRTRP
jgi:hypothetical protein